MDEELKKELYRTRKERRKKRDLPRHALGVRVLPKCPAKGMKLARRLGPPHTDVGHICQECRCKQTAGGGTTHFGVGYCYTHEKLYSKEMNERVAMNQAHAIQQGYPDKPYRYLDNKDYAEAIAKKADECEGVLHSREEAIVIQSQIQRVLNSLNGTGEVTERVGKDGDLEDASDEVKIKLLARLTTAYSQLAKLELAISDDKYVPIEQVMAWISAFVRIIEQKTDEETYNEILKEVKKVPQPRPGRKKR